MFPSPSTTSNALRKSTPVPERQRLVLVAVGALVGIDLVDHVVLGDARYCSFKEMGRI